MKIVRQQPDTRLERWQQWHILTVGESGFTMLDIYGRLQRGLDIDVIRQFADRINETDESGTLHPRAPISALPFRFFRDQANYADPAVMRDFKHHVAWYWPAAHQDVMRHRAGRFVIAATVPDGRHSLTVRCDANYE